jgi:predicted RNase H-like HicB family nuclease
MSTYTVRYERDERGWWVARVLGLPGCHTQGRSIAQARGRIREALGLFVENAEEASLIDDVILPARPRTLLACVLKARAEAKSAEAAWRSLLCDTIQLLSCDLKLSLRDVSAILRMSHQRVQQIASRSQKKVESTAEQPARRAARRREGRPSRRALSALPAPARRVAGSRGRTPVPLPESRRNRVLDLGRSLSIGGEALRRGDAAKGGMPESVSTWV